MENNELQEQLRSSMLILENAVLMLIDGKVIPAHNKLLGLKQKLAKIYNAIGIENKNNTKDTNNSFS